MWSGISWVFIRTGGDWEKNDVMPNSTCRSNPHGCVTLGPLKLIVPWTNAETHIWKCSPPGCGNTNSTILMGTKRNNIHVESVYSYPIFPFSVWRQNCCDRKIGLGIDGTTMNFLLGLSLASYLCVFSQQSQFPAVRAIKGLTITFGMWASPQMPL